MTDRRSLHITKLEEFKTWLNSNGIAHRPGKGEYQVLQVKTRHRGWQVIYRKDTMPEHYVVNNGLSGLVHKFLRERRETQTCAK